MIDNQIAVYLAVLNQGEIAVELSQCLDSILATSPYPLFIDYACEKPISFNRNQIVKRFLERPQYDYLIMLDSDIVPTPDYLKLVDFQKDIISGVCFAFTKSNIFPLVLHKDKKPEGKKYHAYTSFHPKEWKGLIEVDAVGTGAIILSRKVLEAVPYPFRNEYDKTGDKEIGLDLNFCRRAKQKGFKVFCHTDYWCSHHTRMDLKILYKTVRAVFEEIDSVNLKLKSVEKKYETLKGKIDNRKNTGKDKKEAQDRDSGVRADGKKKNEISGTEAKDVPTDRDGVNNDTTQKEGEFKGGQETYDRPVVGNDSFGDCFPDAPAQTPPETQAGNTQSDTAQ